MVLPVAALLHVTVPIQPVAVKVAVLPVQIAELLILTFGAEGAGDVLTVKLTEFDDTLLQLFTTQIAE